MPRRWLLATVAVVFVTLIALRPELRPGEDDTGKPEIVTVTVGGTRVVANGRAQVWLAQVAYDGRDGAPSADIEITCGGESFPARITLGERPADACDCWIRLTEVLETEPPSVRLDVQWERSGAVRLQAASQFAPPGRRSSRR
jgi:hypothetical protein